MSTSAKSGDGLDDSERVIDRSGDIDQRPPEERVGGELANALGFGQPARNARQLVPAVQHYEAPPPPPVRFQPPPQGLAEVAHRLQKDLDKQYTRAKSQLDQLSQKIEAQEKRCLPPKLDDDLQQIRFQRQKVLIANGPALAGCLREERNRLADLETFKAENRLSRDAHYPSSPVLAVGILSVLVLLEAGINGVLFADSSDQGLFGGWLEALVLSMTNVGAAFLFGRVVLPQLHRRGLLLKTGAAVLCMAGLAALIAVNLIGAHYRDFRSSTANLDVSSPAALKHEMGGNAGRPKPVPAGTPSRKVTKTGAAEPAESLPREGARKEEVKEREAIRKFVEGPFAFDSFMSVFLFVIGLCCACIAALDGYKLDDPFPGYGRRHRRYSEAREQSAQTLRRILSQSNAIMTGSFQAVSRKIETFAHDLSALLALHHTYAGEHKALQEGLEEAARDAEAQIVRHDRLINKVPGRDSRDLFVIAVRQLPQLNEKQVRFYETQDKKLKALQKSAMKEQSDVLGVFETASADFQKLLADASQASLKASLPGGLHELPGGAT